MQKKEDIQEILKKLAKGEATADEQAKAERWLLQLNQEGASGLSEEQVKVAGNAIWAKLDGRKPAKRLVSPWRTYAAAAAVVVALLVGALFYTQRGDGHWQRADVGPGKNGATLTLADGTQILIDETTSGDIAQQAGVRISKDANGQLTYEVAAAAEGELAYNTLTTSRGEQSRVRLPDGTLVSLNAASSLRYPVRFSDTDRRTVSLTGEGYFAVTADKNRPFVVKTAQQQVEVLGTQFNVNAYSDLMTVTTLESGAVRVSTASATQLIAPGQQVLNDGNALTVSDADMDQALGWKDGNFVFMGADIQLVMEQLARWYDVEVVYEGAPVTGLFYVNISRNRNISEILQVLAETNAVRFDIAERRVTVRR